MKTKCHIIFTIAFLHGWGCLGAGALPKLWITRVSTLLRPGVGNTVVLKDGTSINRRIWLEDHFESKVEQAAFVAIDAQTGARLQHTLRLPNIAMPVEIQSNPANAKEFLFRATGIKQDPAVIPGPPAGRDAWDNVLIRPDRLVVGGPAYTRSKLGKVNLRTKELKIFQDVDGEVVLVWEPIAFDDLAGSRKALFGSAAMIPLAMTQFDLPPLTAQQLILNEAQLWIYPYQDDYLNGLEPPLLARSWDTGVVYVYDLLGQILAHPSLSIPLAALNDMIVPFAQALEDQGIDWESGTLSLLPFDLWSWGDRTLRLRIEQQTEDGTRVINADAFAPVDVLEIVSSKVSDPLDTELEWIEHNDLAPPFVDADIIQPRLLADEGTFDATWESFTVLEDHDMWHKFTVKRGVAWSLQVLYNDALSHSTKLEGSNIATHFEVGARPIFNNLVGGGWYRIRTGAPCQVHLYKNCSQSLEDNGHTRLEWHYNKTQVFVEIDRSRKRADFLFTARAGEEISIGAHPIRGPTNATDYNVRMELDLIQYPFMPKITADPTNATPQTVIQQWVAPHTSEFYKLALITDHDLINLQACLTLVRGALDVQGVEATETQGKLGRIQ